MSWKTGLGQIGVGTIKDPDVGTRELSITKINTDEEDMLLPAGSSVLVVNTDFKLV